MDICVYINNLSIRLNDVNLSLAIAISHDYYNLFNLVSIIIDL